MPSTHVLDRIKPFALLAIVSALVFLPHLIGLGVYVGDSDRMNHSLTALAAYIQGFSTGVIPLWNPKVFGGYSLVALPYQYPNPVALLAYLLGVKDIYHFAGYEAMVLLCFAGWSAYLFIRTSGRSQMAAFVGAVLYQTCALSILKIGQNDMSFLSIVLIPILLLGVKRLAKRPCVLSYSILFFVALALLNFSFLQKVAYAILLASAYAIWLSREQRSWRPLLLSISAAAPAVILAFPRLITVAQDFSEGNRTPGPSLGVFELYNATGFSLLEILRWFDERIFGATFLEMAKLGNGFNAHEGFLIYMTAFAPFLLAYALFKRLPWRAGENDAKFSVFVCLVVFTCVLTAPGYWMLWRSFFRIEFIHFRVLILALLPLSLLIALAIDSFRDIKNSAQISVTKANAWNIALLAFAVIISIEVFAQFANNMGFQTMAISGHRLQGGSVLRILASLITLGVLWWLAVSGALNGKQIQIAVSVLVCTQATAFAMLTVWGPGRWADPTAFKTPTRAFAKLGEFSMPSDAALASLHGRLEAQEFRTSFICPPDQVGIFCPTHIANFWGLRSIDGYVSNVPRRLASLPLGAKTSNRVITFFSQDQLDWPLLGLFNVKYAVDFRPELFTNAVKQPGNLYRELRPSDLLVHENTKPVAPRVFFSESIITVPDINAAIEKILPGGKSRQEGYTPAQQSISEGFPSDGKFVGSGEIKLTVNWNTATVAVSPAEGQRFLVLNERYDKNWVALDNSGNELPIYPTNVFMRGVVVEPGVTSIEFEYRPFMARIEAWYFYVVGAILAILGLAFVASMNRKTMADNAITT